MSTFCRRRTLTHTALLFALAVPAATVAAPQTPDRPEFEESVAQWVQRLDSDDFAVRQKATERLRNAGAAAVPALVEAAQEGSLEVVSRAVSILEELYVSGQDEATVDAAETALDELMQSENESAAGRAVNVVEANYALREQRAVAKIEALGGVVERAADRAVIVNGRAVFIRKDSPWRPIDHVRLGTDWKGGDEGLKYVKRLTHLERLYLIDGVLSKQAENDLLASMPNLEIQHRGRAYLGIGGRPHPNGCLVVQVKPGTAAAKAGMQPGDVIVEFAGKTVPDFQTLIDLIAERNPGDKVVAKALRGGFQNVQLQVELGGWSDTGGPEPAPQESPEP